MKILVCVKQVPGSNNVEVDPVTGVLKRSGIPSKINPYDLYGIETALTLAEQAGSPKAANIVLMGHLSRNFDFTEGEWLDAIAQSVPPKFLELNKTAFLLGRNA